LKNFTLLLAAGLLFVTSLSAQTQKGTNQLNPKQKGLLHQPQARCGTDEMIAHRLQTDPEFKARYDAGLKQYEESLKNPGDASRTSFTSTLTGPVTIPIVIHIVLPDPTVVTDADVLYIVNRLNLDYSGFNPDSTNGSLFYSVRGHSLIRWTLAKRDPAGNYSTGIERRVGSGAIQGGNPQPIKSFAQGGLDAWDINNYYNLWVGDGGASGLLGIAPEIGVGGPAGSTNTDGVCVDYRGFSHNPCYSYAQFALGRTACHEIGHNFGLYHNFQGGCAATNDFGQLTSPGACGATGGLPASLLGPADDTPRQTANTSGCPSGAVNGGCGDPFPPGKMYQCYMDYTDDPCYSMFSAGEVARMHWVLENCRAGYLTTLGGVAPASAPTLDAAATAVVNPGGSMLVGTGRYTDPANNAVFTCQSFPTPSCPTAVTPRLRIQNRGVNTLTTVTVTEQLNGVTVAGTPQTITVNLPTLQDTVVTLPLVNLVGGTNTLKFWVSNPNAGADVNNANDTITKVINFTGATLPLVQGFETTPYPPTGWAINNPNNDFTWVRVAPGSSSTASIAKDNYDDFNNGRFDDMITPVIATTGLDSVIISYDIAKQYFPGLPDRFDIMVSTNCGATYTSVYNLSDPALSTAGANTGPYTVPGAADWVRRRISIGGANLGTGQILIAFRNTTGYGNNIFLDNINISGFTFTNRDLTPTAVLRPLTQECSPTIAPSITVKNSGLQAVSSFQVGYIVDNGAPSAPQTFTPAGGLAPNATTNVTLNAATFTVGTHTMKIYTLNPTTISGTGDLFTANDTITKVFTVNQLYTGFNETFEGVTPPAMPTQITVVNPNADNTWVSTNPGRASKHSGFINNYNFNTPGRFDDMKFLPINTVGVDSVVISFDVAHKNYPGLDDILAVMASTDCGNVYAATAYNKPGSVLATAGSSTAAYTAPGAGDWRRDRLALGGAFMSTGSLILALRNTNGYGNNIFIDNINITRKFKRDLAVTSIIQPTDVVCGPTVNPVVTVQNVGSEAVTAYQIGFSIDGVAGTPIAGTGVPLAPGATTTVTFTVPATFTQAPHVFQVYTINPTSATGTGDLNLTNDTLKKNVTRVASVAPPISEGFESTTFPPAGWAVVNPDNGITWRRTTAAARTGIASAYVNNYNYAVNGQKDDLYTPQLTYTGVDSVSLSFDVAAITYSYPGTTTIPLDTLEVLVTKDCGATFTSVYKKWGHELQTVNDPNSAQPVEFFPTGPTSWRTESMDLTGLAAGNGPLQVVFRNTSNFENNIFIDNVNVKTRTLPARLKNDGFLILPNPFKDQFTVWHYLQPTDLRYITVYNSAGQLVWRKDFSGDADKQVSIDLSTRSAGVYVVHLGYNDANRNTSVRIIKL
jgi:hypothetical protein